MRRYARLVAASAVLCASEPQGPVSDNLKKLLPVEERVIEDERPIGHAMMREQAIDHALSEKGRVLGASLSPPAECVQDSWDDPGSRSASDPDLLTASAAPYPQVGTGQSHSPSPASNAKPAHMNWNCR